MKYFLSLVESDAQINQSILNNLAPLVQKKIDQAIPKIINEAKVLIKNRLIFQQEYYSLTSPNGKLRLEFGIAEVSLVDNAIDAFLDTLFISNNKIIVKGRGLSGGFSLNFMPISAISSIANAFSVITEKGQSLPWLKWLLLDGIDLIVKDYDVIFGTFPSSRTGGAIMVESKKSWRVPPEFAGTIEDNWIIRSIDGIEKNISSIFIKNIQV